MEHRMITAALLKEKESLMPCNLKIMLQETVLLIYQKINPSIRSIK